LSPKGNTWKSRSVEQTTPSFSHSGVAEPRESLSVQQGDWKERLASALREALQISSHREVLLPGLISAHRRRPVPTARNNVADTGRDVPVVSGKDLIGTLAAEHDFEAMLCCFATDLLLYPYHRAPTKGHPANAENLSNSAANLEGSA